jgi:hypothetical protein
MNIVWSGNTWKCSRVAGAIVASIIAAVAPIATLAKDGPAPFTVIETGKGYARLQSAIDAIGSGRGAIAIAPGRITQCAVQSSGDIAYLAVEPGSAIFDGVACEGKGALVLRGRSAEVSGLVFENIRVPDFNGAGIRLEHGNLTVAQSWFRDSQQGILTGATPRGRWSSIVRRSAGSAPAKAQAGAHTPSIPANMARCASPAAASRKGAEGTT